MRQIAFLFLLIIAFGCEQRKAQIQSTALSDADVPPAFVSIDTTDGQQFRAIIQEGKSNITLTENETSIIDKMLQHKVEEHNRNVDKRFAIDLSKYNRQYFPTVNANGEKVVEVNCFCQVHDNNDWKKYRVQVEDGGTCYFNFKVNLKAERVLGFYVNGEA